MDAQTAAAINNAAWCDIVCRCLGLATGADDDLWWVEPAPPPLYPDAVTLRRQVGVDHVLSAVADRPTAAVKDSFAALDLDRHDFRVLSAARWIRRRGGPFEPVPRGWSVIEDGHALGAWSAGWSVGAGDSAGNSGTFPPSLLGVDGVRVLARYDTDDIGAGAILNLAGGVVGVSNVFTVSCSEEPAENPWAGVSALAGRLFPGRDLVGYEHGAELAAARSAGFGEVGDLRIWVRDR